MTKVATIKLIVVTRTTNPIRATYNCPIKQILILILTDSVIINIIPTIHTVLYIKIKIPQIKHFKIVYISCRSQMFFKIGLL